MSNDITVIDLEAANRRDPEALGDLATAAQEIGIVQVINHGAAQTVIDGFHDRLAAILALPRDEKALLASPTGHPYRGWRQWPDDQGLLELERYTFAQFDDPQEAKTAGLSEEQAELFSHRNVWPPRDETLRDLVSDYRRATTKVGRRTLRALAVALGKDEDVFPLTVGSGPEHVSITVNNYPAWPYDSGASDEQKLLLLEHADGSAVTVLHQRGDYAGLQGQRLDGSWLPVPVRSDALQVFFGSLTSRWTNGLVRPGRHRVIAGGNDRRLSTGTFVHPPIDAIVEPLAEFVGSDEAEFDPLDLWEGNRTSVDEYLRVFGRPDQVAAWKEGRRYVAALSDASVTV